jgi:hypothetical protein
MKLSSDIEESAINAFGSLNVRKMNRIQGRCVGGFTRSHLSIISTFIQENLNLKFTLGFFDDSFSVVEVREGGKSLFDALYNNDFAFDLVSFSDDVSIYYESAEGIGLLSFADRLSGVFRSMWALDPGIEQSFRAEMCAISKLGDVAEEYVASMVRVINFPEVISGLD